MQSAAPAADHADRFGQGEQGGRFAAGDRVVGPPRIEFDRNVAGRHVGELPQAARAGRFRPSPPRPIGRSRKPLFSSVQAAAASASSSGVVEIRPAPKETPSRSGSTAPAASEASFMAERGGNHAKLDVPRHDLEQLLAADQAVGVEVVDLSGQLGGQLALGKARRRPMPDRPCIRLFQNASLPMPMGETTPTPVMTVRIGLSPAFIIGLSGGSVVHPTQKPAPQSALRFSDGVPPAEKRHSGQIEPRSLLPCHPRQQSLARALENAVFSSIIGFRIGRRRNRHLANRQTKLRSKPRNFTYAVVIRFPASQGSPQEAIAEASSRTGMQRNVYHCERFDNLTPHQN